MTAVIDRLLDEHRQLIALSDHLRELIDLPHAPPVEELNSARWEISRLILRHLPVEERHVYRRLHAHPRADVAAMARRFSAELDQSYAVFEQHSRAWAGSAAADNWATYGAATRRLLDGMRLRIRMEETCLYPLLEDAPDIPAERSADSRNWAADGWKIRERLGR